MNDQQRQIVKEFIELHHRRVSTHLRSLGLLNNNRTLPRSEGAQINLERWFFDAINSAHYTLRVTDAGGVEVILEVGPFDSRTGNPVIFEFDAAAWSSLLEEATAGMKYHINQDSLGDTSEFLAKAFVAAVQKALPEVEIVLCPEGQPQSNTEEVENLYEPEVSRIWGEMGWFSREGPESVTIDRNSQGGWTVQWPSAENPGLFHEKHFTPAVGYRCRAEAVSFAKLKREEHE
jgi:hypothetical protein